MAICKAVQVQAASTSRGCRRSTRPARGLLHLQRCLAPALGVDESVRMNVRRERLQRVTLSNIPHQTLRLAALIIMNMIRGISRIERNIT